MESVNFKWIKGQEMVDVITGFKGYITYRVDYLTGCTQYGLQPKMKKGDKEAPESRQVDENRLAPTGKFVTLPSNVEHKAEEKKGEKNPGGPQPNINKKKRSYERNTSESSIRAGA